MTDPFAINAAGRRLGRALRRRPRLREGVVQLVYLLVAAALAVLVPRIPVGFTVPGDEVRTMLLSIGAAILTFIGVVFSLLFLVVQFGSTTFTPRLNLFRYAPIVWHSFAYFSAVFVFCFLGAFTIGRDQNVSGLIPIVAGVAVLAVFAVFRALQFAAFRSIQLAPSLAQVTARGHQVIEGIYPDQLPADTDRTAVAGRGLNPGSDSHEVTWRDRPAVLQLVDVPRLLRLAEDADVVVELRVGASESLLEGDRIAVVHGTADTALDAEIRTFLHVGVERTFEQDPGLAVRVLADIALRGLSAAINDPTTAVQALDAMHSLLRALVTRDLDIGALADTRGRLRVLLTLPGWEDYLGVAVDEIISMGSSSVQVRRRVERLLADLALIAPPARREAVQTRLDRLHATDPARPEQHR